MLTPIHTKQIRLAVLLLTVTLLCFLLIALYRNIYGKSTSLYDIAPNGIVSLYGETISSEQSTEDQLVGIIRIALKYCHLSISDSSLKPLNSNFAKLHHESAMSLVSKMKRSPTFSHNQAWQLAIPEINGYAIKLYYNNKGDSWEISIIETGWNHYLDALQFLLRLPNYAKVNINNSYGLLFLLRQKILQ